MSIKTSMLHAMTWILHETPPLQRVLSCFVTSPMVYCTMKFDIEAQKFSTLYLIHLWSLRIRSEYFDLKLSGELMS